MKVMNNMKERMIDIMILLAILILINSLIHQKLLPERTAELALTQMSNPEAGARVRIIELLSNWVTPVLAVAGVIGTAWIFGKGRAKTGAQ